MARRTVGSALCLLILEKQNGMLILFLSWSSKHYHPPSLADPWASCRVTGTSWRPRRESTVTALGKLIARICKSAGLHNLHQPTKPSGIVNNVDLTDIYNTGSAEKIWLQEYAIIFVPMLSQKQSIMQILGSSTPSLPHTTLLSCMANRQPHNQEDHAQYEH